MLGAWVHSINVSSSYPYFQRKEQNVWFLQMDTLARANVTCGTGCDLSTSCSLLYVPPVRHYKVRDTVLVARKQ